MATIRLKRSGTSGAQPVAANLVYGEITLNYADGTLYFRKANDTLGTISGGGGGTVTSIAGTGTVNGLTLTGTVTTSGNLTLGGTLSGIENSALTNSSITINGTSVALGGTRTINLADLGTVTITSPSNGQVLKYNGTAWVNDTDVTGSGGITLSSLSASSSGDGSLSYNNTTGVFTYTGPSVTNYRGALSFTAGSGAYNSTTGVITIPTNTNQLTNGSSYITLTSLSATTASGVSYNNTTGVFSLSSIPNTSLTNSSITINGTSVSLGGTRTLDTDAISEGTTNKYYTDARADTRADARIAASSINALADVNTVSTAPTDGQALAWSTAVSAWIPQTISGGAGGGISQSAAQELAIQMAIALG